MLRTISFILCSLLFCSCVSELDEIEADKESNRLVNLKINVSISDVAKTLTRIEGNSSIFENASSDFEKMKSLRVIIVRPNGIVEANRYLDLTTPSLLHHITEKFEVKANERKQIYLFANESAKAINNNSGEERSLIEYDFNEITEQDAFPLYDITTLKIRMDESETFKGDLPMSELHVISVTNEDEQNCALFVSRAAVKFTYRFINNSTKQIKLGQFKINNMANEEWCVPRAVYTEPDTDGNRETSEYYVPEDINYYTYQKYFDNQTIDPNTTFEVNQPIYFLEGKYIDKNDSRNYSTEITIDNLTQRLYFPDLKTLPRNTHVVVNIKYNWELDCIVEVKPYTEIILKPEFGI